MLFDYAQTFPIYGPPGTGKTTRCIAIVADLIEKGINPSQIAYVAFTKKAAWEATDRVAKQLKITKTGMQHFSTIHAMANRVYKSEYADSREVMKPRDYEKIGDRLSLPVRAHWKITEDADFIASGGVQYGPGDFALSQIRLARSRRIDTATQMSKHADPMDFARFNCIPSKVMQFEAGLESFKHAEGKYDFDDMLERAVECSPLPIRYAIIDEAQDLSAAQWRVCHYLLRNCEKVWIAGDDDQAIYRFSGADAGTFLQMGKLDTAEVLHQTYRLPQAIYEYSQKLVVRIKERVQKDFTTQKEGGKVTRSSLLRDLPLDEGEWMFLVRNRGHMKTFEEFLRRKTYTYRMDGKSSVPREHLKAIRAWEHARKGEQITREDVGTVFRRLELGKGVKRGHKTNVMTKLPEQKSYGWDDMVACGLLLSREVPWFDALVGLPEKQTLYLRGVAKRGDLFKDPRISVHTIHGVKGGEADNVVIMPQMGRLTWDNYIKGPDDEHRCAYVAATRAKKNLHILADGDMHMAYPY